MPRNFYVERGYVMQDTQLIEFYICFHSEQEEIAFIKATESATIDIDLIKDHTTIDAKSMLGVLSLGLNQVIKVVCHGKDQAFLDAVSQFQCESLQKEEE